MMKNKLLLLTIILLLLILLFSCTTETIVDEMPQEVIETEKIDGSSPLDNKVAEEELTDIKVEEDAGENKEEVERQNDDAFIEEEQEELEDTEQTIEEIDTTDQSLVLHLEFENDISDSANGYGAELIGGEFRQGVIGNALYFDGVEDYVKFSIKAIDEIGSLDQGSIAFWMKYESILNSQELMPIFYLGVNEGLGVEDNMYLIEIGHGDLEGANNKKLYSTWIKDNQMPFLCSDSSVDIQEDEWVHFVITAGPGGNSLFLNGEELGARDYNFGHAQGDSFLSDIPVREFMALGYGRSSFMISPEFEYYKGLLDDFRIYDRILDADEIAKLAVR